MKLIRLYIENFMCYDKSFIDFNQFSAALIVGKIEGSDLVANGVGKTTIFRAIEYVLFNQSDSNLEKIIRDDTNSCKIVLDFIIGNQEYRIARTRTKKGATDVKLLQRNNVNDLDTTVYHAIVSNLGYDTYSPFTDKDDIKKYWKDISGSRSSDTEKDLAKLIKFNYKSLRSTNHFMQNDFSGLSTATPEKRKGILKEALDLIIYTKLEKIAKEKAGTLSKEIDKNLILLDSLGDPNKDIIDFKNQMIVMELNLNEKNNNLISLNEQFIKQSDKINELVNAHSNLENKFTLLLSQEKSLLSEKNRAEISVKEYKSKKSNIIKITKDFIEEIKILKESQIKLAKIDYSQIDILSENINNIKEQLTCNNIIIKDNIEKYDDLKIPLPSGSACKNCRKPMTDKDRKEHKAHISKEMEECQLMISNAKKQVILLNTKILAHQQTINDFNLFKQQLEIINTKIAEKNKEIQDKKSLHEEYSILLDKFIIDLKNKDIALENLAEDLKKSSIEEARLIQIQIESEKKKLGIITVQVSSFNKEIAHFNNNLAVLKHTLNQRLKDQDKFNDIKKILINFEKEFSVYPLVLQAFSSTGIPNLIIQNVLDDLQVEANNILSQLKPGLQLSFSVEKTIEKTGDQADTLDINYQINGKDRYYELLSGAQKLAIMFSLKLGLSFLLQKMLGVNIQFLLFDEIDQSLDKASIDAFADIVKFFQKDFTILIITHNDRLKDKFSHAILVEQDINMVSRAKVVTSW